MYERDKNNSVVYFLFKVSFCHPTILVLSARLNLINTWSSGSNGRPMSPTSIHPYLISPLKNSFRFCILNDSWIYQQERCLRAFSRAICFPRTSTLKPWQPGLRPWSTCRVPWSASPLLKSIPDRVVTSTWWKPLTTVLYTPLDMSLF